MWNFGKSVKKWKNIETAKNSKNWKILEKPGGKWQNLKNLVESVWKSEKPGGKWENVKNLVESGKIL